MARCGLILRVSSASSVIPVHSACCGRIETRKGCPEKKGCYNEVAAVLRVSDLLSIVQIQFLVWSVDRGVTMMVVDPVLLVHC